MVTDPFRSTHLRSTTLHRWNFWPNHKIFKGNFVKVLASWNKENANIFNWSRNIHLNETCKTFCIGVQYIRNSGMKNLIHFVKIETQLRKRKQIEALLVSTDSYELQNNTNIIFVELVWQHTIQISPYPPFYYSAFCYRSWT